VVELELPAVGAGDASGMRDVPDLAFDVVVAAVYALAQPVVEAAEVAAALGPR
jgi:hypothetical protein